MYVRPWALAVPILVLLVSLPLLRPLRHPGPNGVSDGEAARLATMAAITDRHSLSLEGLDLGTDVPLPTTGLIRWHGRVFSDQPPTMAVILAGVYWILKQFGLTLRSSPVLTPYLLTLICVTIPVAAAAGLIYKMSRLFELRRPVRTAFAAAVTFGSGLISYAVVLNAHAPAAALVLASVATLIYVSNCRKPRRNIWWLIASGCCAGLAMTLDPPAAVFPLPLMAAIFAMRWPIVRRSAGAALFALGVAVFVYLHLALNYPITGDWKPAILHPELTLRRAGTHAELATWQSVDAWLIPARQAADTDDDQPRPADWKTFSFVTLPRFGQCLMGDHGLLSHFPILLLGIVGIYLVARRNWPGVTKSLAIACGVGSLAIVAAYTISPADERQTMFANHWFVVFVPLVLFWSGAWLRRRHGIIGWTLAAALLLFSVAVSLVGATDPQPRAGYDRYTAAQAAHRFFWPAAQLFNPPIASADIGRVE